MILCNNIGLLSKAAEYIDTESTEKLVFLTQVGTNQCRLTPAVALQRTNYRWNL